MLPLALKTASEPDFTDAVNVFVAVVRFVSVTAIVFVCPEPFGTAPKLTLTGSRATAALTALPRFSRPEPIDRTLVAFLIALASAVLMTAERTCSADSHGRWPSTTAAEPARCGVAIDVPWKNAKHGGAAQPNAGIELMTFTPGATTSGLIRK